MKPSDPSIAWIDEKPLGLAERLYLPLFIQGLTTTAKVFLLHLSILFRIEKFVPTTDITLQVPSHRLLIFFLLQGICLFLSDKFTVVFPNSI